MKYWIVLSLLLMTVFTARSQPAVSLGVGASEEDMQVYRIAFRYDWESRWFETDVGYLTGYHELSANLWHWSPDDADAYGGFYSPVFRYVLGTEPDRGMYFEIGVGVGLISETTFATRGMGSAFQFEDRFGLGLDFGHHDLAFRYVHYSNASIAPPNDGMDIFLWAYTYHF